MKIVTMILGAAFLLIVSLFLLFALVRPAHASATTPPGADRGGPPVLHGRFLPWRSGASFATVSWQRFRALPSWWN